MLRVLGTAAAAAMLPAAAQGGIVLSQAVIDIGPAAATAQDVEVWNNGTDTAYVIADPYEITDPGTAAETRTRVADPAAGGLLVSPQKLILQPGERKLVRIAAIAGRPPRDRVYRVTIKPVAGSVSAPQSAIKLLVGYDALVIYRPQAPAATITAERNGTTLTLANRGNTNAELYDGTLCPGAEANTGCTPLPPRRLYAGATWTQTLPAGAGQIRYRMLAVGTSQMLRF